MAKAAVATREVTHANVSESAMQTWFNEHVKQHSAWAKAQWEWSLFRARTSRSLQSKYSELAKARTLAALARTIFMEVQSPSRDNVIKFRIGETETVLPLLQAMAWYRKLERLPATDKMWTDLYTSNSIPTG